MKKKIYLSPSIKVKAVEPEGIMDGSGSITIGISDDPATGAAQSKGNSFITSDESSSFGSGSVWSGSGE